MLHTCQFMVLHTSHHPPIQLTCWRRCFCGASLSCAHSSPWTAPSPSCALATQTSPACPFGCDPLRVTCCRSYLNSTTMTVTFAPFAVGEEKGRTCAPCGVWGANGCIPSAAKTCGHAPHAYEGCGNMICDCGGAGTEWGACRGDGAPHVGSVRGYGGVSACQSCVGEMGSGGPTPWGRGTRRRGPLHAWEGWGSGIDFPENY